MLATYRGIWQLLQPAEKRRAYLLLVLMLLVGLVEVAGVASILPLIAVLSNPGLVESNRYLKFAYDSLHFTEHYHFLIFLALMTFLIVVLRTALLAFSSYATIRYISMRGHALTTRLLRTYLGRKYAWFLDRHSADLSNTLFSEVAEVVSSGLFPALQLISQGIVAVCIIVLIVSVDPVVALLATLTLGTVYSLIYVGVRNLIERIARERQAAGQERFRIAQEALGGIKEIKVGGFEAAYLRRFETASQVYEKRRSGLQVLGDMPRYALEVTAIGGMLLVVLALLMRNNGELSATLPAVAVFAFAGVRLLPVMQSVYKAAVTLKSSNAALARLRKDLEFEGEGVRKNLPPPMQPSRAIELEGVTFTYSSAKGPALRDVSLIIPIRSSVAFVGKTGAGKSTIVDIILGLLEPQSGRIVVDGTVIGGAEMAAWQQAIGYVPQQIFLFDDTIAANIAFGQPADKIDLEAVEKAARLANLHEFISEQLPNGYQTQVGERGVRLSGGQRQRLGIARALYADPQVLILDEATSALDSLTEQAIMQAVGILSGRKTVILIAHRLTTVRNCDRIFVMERGSVVQQGTWEDLMQQEGPLAEMADVHAA